MSRWLHVVAPNGPALILRWLHGVPPLGSRPDVSPLWVGVRGGCIGSRPCDSIQMLLLFLKTGCLSSLHVSMYNYKVTCVGPVSSSFVYLFIERCLALHV